MELRIMRKAFGLIFVLALGAAAVEAQPAALVADINTTQEDFAYPLFTGQDFAVMGGTLFFVQDDGTYGAEVWKTNGTEAGTVMVKDICPGACTSRPFRLTVLNGALYFGADDNVHGVELWRTDGTAAGTSLVADIRPGTGGSLYNLFKAGGVLYTLADDGSHGQELWKTDGTAAGTQLIADLRPGPEGSSPRLWLDLGSRLLLNADDGVHGREPWVSDGTTAGTVLLKDVNPGTGDSTLTGSIAGAYENDAIVLSGGAFLFTADDGTHGAEPWRSDGTEAGTALLKDLYPGNQGSWMYGPAMLGSIAVFGAYGPTVGWELWSTDGTEAGTGLLKDVNPLNMFSASSTPRQLTAFGGRLYFSAFDGSTGRELWATDGTEAGTVLVKDIKPGSGDGLSPFDRVVLRPGNGSLLFFGNDGTHGVELWRTDGTEAGTIMVKDIEPGSVSGTPYGYSGITVLGTSAFFHGFTSGHSLELWKSDGTEAGTVEVKNIGTVTSSLQVLSGYPALSFGKLGSRLLFDAGDGISGLEPWATNGTAATTEQLADTRPGPQWGAPFQFHAPTGLLTSTLGELWKTDGTPAGTSRFVPQPVVGYAESSLVPLGSSWLFEGNSLGGGSELWKTDGTEAGTQQVLDIRPGSNGSNPAGFAALGSILLFSAQADSNGYELWKSDGTAPGTVLVKDVSTFSFGGSPAEITPLGSRAVFTAYDNSGTKRDLWATDGTAPGTVFLQADAGGLVRFKDFVLFTAVHPLGGRELWKTDGTPAGTVLLSDIRPGLGSSFPSPNIEGGTVWFPTGSAFVFVADGGVYGAELWGTAGAASVPFIKDIYPGPRSSDIESITPVRGRLFFVADDGVHGRELWVSDGTEAGTRMVKDIVPGPGSPVIQHLTAMGHVVLFNATDGVQGVEIWKSDGTEAGTVMLQDIAPGAASSSPAGFFSAFPNVYFAANDNVAGFELWSMPRSALGPSFTDVPVGYWAWSWIEALADSGLTRGCDVGLYCPSRPVLRGEMAVFLLRAVHGAFFVPPEVSSTRFDDVPASHWAASWIEQLANDGLTTGCSASPPRFCPEGSTTRAEMAVFLLRALHGAGYTPPPATGTRFTDVPASYWAAAWVEQLAAEGITTGCTPTTYCPDDPVNRDQMAVFLSRALSLPLP